MSRYQRAACMSEQVWSNTGATGIRPNDRGAGHANPVRRRERVGVHRLMPAEAAKRAGGAAGRDGWTVVALTGARCPTAAMRSGDCYVASYA